jgi:SAM-dependent methyltransferase
MVHAPYQPATNYWRAIEICEIVRYGLPTGRGLDIGCGDGHVMQILLQHLGDRDQIGIDIDKEETAIARERNTYSGVVTTAAHCLPFGDNCFQYAFSNSVLEHIEPIQEIARVLRPRGRFLFTVPGPEFHQCLRGSTFEDRAVYLRDVDARCAHLRYWDEKEWKAHLRAAGFEIVHLHGYLQAVQVQRWEKIAKYTSGVLYRLSRGKRQPIEIQRRFGVRSARIRFPHFLASAASRVLSFGVPAGSDRFGCLLVEAERNP